MTKLYEKHILRLFSRFLQQAKLLVSLFRFGPPSPDPLQTVDGPTVAVSFRVST